MNHRNKRQIVGQAPCCEQLVPSNKFLHIGKLRLHVKSDSVCEYIANKLGVDTATIICKPLVKNGLDVATLEFLNFKLGILSSTFRLFLVMQSGPIQSKSVYSSTGICRLLIRTFWICTFIIHRTQKATNNPRLWCRFDYGIFMILIRNVNVRWIRYR